MWRRSNWKSIFLKTNVIFFALLVYQGSNTKEKIKKCSMENNCASINISIEAWMKELNRVF